MKEQELCHLLALELGWDADLTNQVVNSVKQHALEDSLQGVDEIVQVLSPLVQLFHQHGKPGAQLVTAITQACAERLLWHVSSRPVNSANRVLTCRTI